MLRLGGRATVRRGRLPLGVIAQMAIRHYAAPVALRVELAHTRLWPLRARHYAQGEPALIVFTLESATFVPRPH